jgi:Mlc titration factor MtfA (ptsG expression regulator)
MFDFFKSRRRISLRAQPFPEAWRATVAANAPYIATLSAEDRAELEGHMQVFLAEKKFEGCAGLEVTDEIRVTIAAQACRLLLHRETDYFPDLEVILVYPHSYIAKTSAHVSGGLAVSDEQARRGQSAAGVVVLAWDAVRRAATDVHDGHNVTLHEFAHQLDQEGGAAEGAPVLSKRAMYTAWAHVLGDEFAHLVEDVEKHRKSDIDEYGATNPAEFFAVVTEAFFEKPEQLKRRHPQLYEQLALFYRQDPVAAAVKARPNAVRGGS